MALRWAVLPLALVWLSSVAASLSQASQATKTQFRIPDESGIGPNLEKQPSEVQILQDQKVEVRFLK